MLVDSIRIVPEDLRPAVLRMINSDVTCPVARDEIAKWCVGKPGICQEDVYRLACCAFSVTSRRECANFIEVTNTRNMWEETFHCLCNQHQIQESSYIPECVK